MPSLLTNTIFYEKLLEALDKNFEIKYRNQDDTMFKTDKSFLYANISNILDINNPYNLEKITTSFDNKYLVKNNFSHEIILINIAIISTNILSDELNKFYNSIKGIEKEKAIIDLDKLFAKDNNVDVNFKKYSKSFIPNIKELNYIQKLYNDQQHFPLGDIYFMNALKKFKKIINKRFINKKYNKYNYNKSLDFSDEFINSKIHNSLSYNDVINNTLEKAYNEAYTYLKKVLL